MIGPVLRHLGMTLRLNFRSRQAMAYGYVIPVFFLFAFAAIFRGDDPVLLPRMGQLVTVTILGGACFGMPTALVAERERGIWRRYRLLPAPLVGLVGSTLVARYLIVGSAVLVQVGVAWLFYRTPLPAHPLWLAGSFTAAAAAFEGIGLTIAAVADTVPAVQALGQMLFLPMIMIGGVGVPLTSLPKWAQAVAGFFPGRYAVELLQPCFDGSPIDRWGVAGRAAALGVIGAAGFVAGGALFRWESSQRAGRRQYLWALGAVASWGAVGSGALAAAWFEPGPPPPKIVPFHRTAVATTTRAAGPTTVVVAPWEMLTEGQINGVPFAGLPADDDVICPMADSATEGAAAPMRDLVDALGVWEPGQVGTPGDRVRALLAVAAIADLGHHPDEGRVARAVFDRLKADHDPQVLVPVLAWAAIDPDAGAVVTSAKELGLAGPIGEGAVRQRSQLYARKMLGKMLGKLPDPAGRPG